MLPATNRKNIEFMLTKEKRTFENINLKDKVIEVSAFAVIEQEFNRRKIQQILKLDEVELELIIKELVRLCIITEGKKGKQYCLNHRGLEEIISVFSNTYQSFDFNTVYIKYVEMLDLIDKNEYQTENNTIKDTKKLGLKKFLSCWFN